MKRELEYFTDCTMGNDSLRLHDHEVYIGFTNDGGAYAFNDWWNAEGQFAYAEWAKDRIDLLRANYG